MSTGILASVATAILTTLLATVVSVLVIIAACKCHLKSAPGAESALSAKGDGQAVYENVDDCKGGVAVRDPTHIEAVAGEGEQALELKENLCYGTHNL